MQTIEAVNRRDSSTAYAASLAEAGYGADYYAARSARAADDLARLYALLRPYQREQLHKCAARDSIVVMQTGAGKTLIAVALALRQLALVPRRLVVFVANRRLLVEQQYGVFVQHVTSCQVAMVRGGGGATTRSSPEAVLCKAEVGVVVIVDAVLVRWCHTQADFLRRCVSLVVLDEVHHAPGGMYKALLCSLHETCPRAMYNDADHKALYKALTAASAAAAAREHEGDDDDATAAADDKRDEEAQTATTTATTNAGAATTATAVQLLLQPSMLSHLQLPQLLGLTASPAVAYKGVEEAMQRLLATTRCALVAVQSEEASLRATVTTPCMVSITYWPRQEEIVLRCALIEVMRCAMACATRHTRELLLLDCQPLLSVTFQTMCAAHEQNYLRALTRVALTTPRHDKDDDAVCAQTSSNKSTSDAGSGDTKANVDDVYACAVDNAENKGDNDGDEDDDVELARCLAVLTRAQYSSADGNKADDDTRSAVSEEDRLYVLIEVVRLLRTLSESLELLQTLSLTSALAHVVHTYTATHVRAMLRCGTGVVRRLVVPLVAQVYAMVVACRRRRLYHARPHTAATAASRHSPQGEAGAAPAAVVVTARTATTTTEAAAVLQRQESPLLRFASTRMQLLLRLLDGIAQTILCECSNSNSGNSSSSSSSSSSGGSGASVHAFRGIIFVATRVQAYRIEQHLCHSPTLCAALRPCLLIGKNRSAQVRGMTDVQQKDVLARFSSGDVRLLIATSVAEEGIDVQSCNVVVRYHHCPNAASVLQSRGRARLRRSCFVTFASAPAVLQGTEVSLRHVVNSLHEHAQAVQRLTRDDSKAMTALYASRRCLHGGNDNNDDDDDNDDDADEDDDDDNDYLGKVMPWRRHCEMVMLWLQRVHHVRIATIEQRVSDIFGRRMCNVLFLAVLPVLPTMTAATTTTTSSSSSNDGGVSATAAAGARQGVVVTGECVAGKAHVRRHAMLRFCAHAHALGYLQPLLDYYAAVARGEAVVSPFLAVTCGATGTAAVGGGVSDAHVLQPAVYLCGVELCVCRDGLATMDTMRTLLPHAQRVCSFDKSEWGDKDTPLQLLNELLQQRQLPRLRIDELTHTADDDDDDRTAATTAASVTRAGDTQEQQRVLQLSVRTLREVDVACVPASSKSGLVETRYASGSGDDKKHDDAQECVVRDADGVLRVRTRGVHALDSGCLLLLRAMGVTVLRNVSRAQVCCAMEEAQRIMLQRL